MLIELASEGLTYYLKAPFPSRDIDNIKALAVARAHGHGRTNAEELLKQLPKVHPMNKEWLKTADSQSAYACEAALFDVAPDFNWHTPYACAEAP